MTRKLIAMLLAVAMIACCAAAAAEAPYGPTYDEWSEMTDEELYEKAKAEGGELTVYATSSKMLKAEEKFEELYPDINLVIYDLDQDEVLSKCRIEAETGNITADVLQAKEIGRAHV